MHSKQIDIELIDPSPHRRLDLVPLNEARVQELADAYKRKRPVPPIVVREHSKPEYAGRYQVIAGHHRLEAQHLNEAEKVWCTIVVADDDQALTLADEENRAQHDKKRDHAFEAVVAHYRWLMIRLASAEAARVGNSRVIEGAKMTSQRPNWPKESRFVYGSRVRKVKGSCWHGVVVGWYSSSMTELGWAVESERELGSVQIYPDAALEALTLETLKQT